MNSKSAKEIMRSITIILVLVFSSQSIAQSLVGDKTGFETSFSLAKYLPWSQTLLLRNVSSSSSLNFPVPDRYSINAAELHLEFTNSNVLIFHRSQLRVLLNGLVIAQIKLDPDNPRTIADIVLPTEQLKANYNNLQFRVAQHYTDEFCEVPDAPELWTEIDPVKSTISMRMTAKLKSPTLASIGYYIDEKLPAYSLRVLRANKTFSKNDLKWGALVAQGAALRLKFVPLELSDAVAQSVNSGTFSSPPSHSESSDEILIGTVQEIGQFIEPGIKQRIVGPYLGIYPLSGSPDRVLIIISGTSDDEVTVAAKSFASLSFPFPDTVDTVIDHLDLAEVKPYDLESVLESDSIYSFKQLGYQTKTLSGENTGAMHLKLRLPPDLYAREDAEVVLSLHLAYGAAMRRDSTINISLNGVFQNAIHLKQREGAHYLDYKIALPLRAFQAGLNTIDFHPVLTPLETGFCTYRQLDNLVVTLFDDSKIHIPLTNHYIRLPDFKLLARTGFPFNRLNNGTETGIQLLDSSNQTVRSAWQIAAKLAQLTGTPLYNATLSFEPVREEFDLILVGSASKNEASLQGAPAVFSDSATFPYPYLAMPKGSDESFWTNWMDHWIPLDNPADIDHKKTVIQQTGQLGGYSAVMSYQSPWHPGRLIVAFVHNQSATFYNSIRFLLDPKEWNAIDGNVVLWKDQADSLRWQQTNEEFFVGNASPGSRIAYYAAEHQWLWILVVFILIILLAALVNFLLNRFKKEHNPNAEEHHS